MELDLNHSIWSKLGLNKLSLNLSVLVYILYSLYILNAKNTVMSSAVCYTNRKQSRTCHCENENTTEVQCLLNLPNTSCEHNASRSYELFCEVMSQFDCQTKYSVKWNCTDCLDAYTKWLLAVFKPIEDKDRLFECVNNTNLSKSCKDVLAKCPYFVPKNSYGDAPAFDCPLDEKDYKAWNCTSKSIAGNDEH